MKREDIHQRYVRREQELSTLIAAAHRRSHGFMAGEIVSFLVAVSLVALYAFGHTATWVLWLAAVAFVSYVAVRRLDERNDRYTASLLDRQQVQRAEQDYMEGRFSAFDDGVRYASTAHPFATDLDIFGPLSLYQRLCRTVTTGGSDRLAKHLSSLRYDARRATAIDELSKRDGFLEAFKAQGARRRIDTTRVVQALQAAAGLAVPRLFTSRLAVGLVGLSLVGLWLTIVLSIGSLCSGNVPLWWALTEFFAMLFLCSRFLRRLGGVVGTLIQEVAGTMQLVRLVRAEEFMAEHAQLLHGRLHGAVESFDALDGILQSLDRRGNILGCFFANALFARDFFTVRRFYLWQQRYQSRFAEWVEAVSEMDALVSMATFCRNEPSAVWPEVVDSATVVYDAQALTHPFLGERAVGNDVSLADHHYYIITGANMAGKSTFLRAVGMSVVMAMAGLPVCAKHLSLSRFRLFTSMRTSDDLVRGISYFNAELLRLQQLLESVGSSDGVPTLIILDEILKGTNSLDKLNGSRLFLEHVSRCNVTGIVATHDLELSRLADQHPDRFHNRCFEIDLGDHVTYSYRISAGVARNQNATFLLRQLLADTPASL